MDSELDSITSYYLAVFLGQCHSGEFIDNLNDGYEENRGIYTSCASNETAATEGVYHSAWPWAIMKGLDPDYNASNADTNSDDRISLDELFTFAYNYISNQQTPQRWLGDALVPDSSTYIGDGYY
jgi:hypothetical protein